MKNIEIEVNFYNKFIPKDAPSGFGKCNTKIDEYTANCLKGKYDKGERGRYYWSAIDGLALSIARALGIDPWETEGRYYFGRESRGMGDPIEIISIAKKA